MSVQNSIWPMYPWLTLNNELIQIYKRLCQLLFAVAVTGIFKDSGFESVYNVLLY